MPVTISWPSGAQWSSIGRHAVSYSAGAVGGAAGILAFGVAIHTISAGQSADITSALTSISQGVAQVVNGLSAIVVGVSTLVATGMGIWAAHSSSLKVQTAAVAASGAVVVTPDAKLAASVPSPNVVSADEKNALPVYVKAKGADATVAVYPVKP